MPSRTLPVFTRAEVEAHRSTDDCYVTLGDNVYDVSDFVESHPGGPELITDWAGKDITTILKDQDSHRHSEAAYEILEESLVGFVVSQKMLHANGNGKENGISNGTAAGYSNGTNNQAVNGHVNGANGDARTNGAVKTSDDDTGNKGWVHPRTGMSSAEDLNKETDYANDYKTHKFIDLNKPMFLQVWNGGFSKRFYLDQVHRPRHYKGGASAPFFGNFLEPLTKTPWWIIPTLWWPCISYVLYEGSKGFNNYLAIFAYFMVGIAFWTLFEYLLHRFAFHLDHYLPDNRVGVTLHFTLHGVHHYLPMDKYRLVLPPALFLILAWPFWYLAHAIFAYDWYVATVVFAGGIFGYTCYDMTHYFLHHQNLPLWYKQLKKYHLEHHFLDYENGFGVTSKFWDIVFGTEIKHEDLKNSELKTK